MRNFLIGCLLGIACTGCTKAVDEIVDTVRNNAAKPPVLTNTVLYTIKKGEHSSDGSTLKRVDTTVMNFSVRFDSSARYTTQVPNNQKDINKLYGFSDNGAQHHEFSARFGWRWSDGALRLFAYIYNNSKRQEKELGKVAIGSWINCGIKVSGKQYLFTLNGTTTALPRASTTPRASGYQLYPYFGGDEVAPHNIRIEIKNL